MNDYLRDVSGREITAKDFRTWAATNLAVLTLHQLNEKKPTKKGCLQVVKQVAEQLGNTPTVCRKCYIHPAVLESYLDGALELNLTALTEDHSREMWAVEGEVIRFLDARLRNAAPRRTLKAALYA